jgi:hypothetical protein
MAAAPPDSVTLPGREFETAEGLEAEGLIRREFTHGEWAATKVLAPRDLRVIIWQIKHKRRESSRRQASAFPGGETPLVSLFGRMGADSGKRMIAMYSISRRLGH